MAMMNAHPNSRTAVCLPAEIRRDVDGTAERWEVLHQQVSDCTEAIAKALVPAFRQAMEAIHLFLIQLRRFQLYINLVQRWWIPGRFARWPADRWPERWLPELRLE